MSQPRREKTSPAPDGELFPIRTIATLTGVNPITLRAWERRYGLINPVRTPKGHRLYARAHIDLIHRVLTLLDKGMAISQVQHALEGKSAPRHVVLWISCSNECYELDAVDKVRAKT